MTYRLVIGQKTYSSWSMRAWLMLKFVNAQFEEVTVSLYENGARAAVRALGGQTGLAPVLIIDGFPIWDTLAIAETLYERHPSLWPSDAIWRARARSYAGELHSGFNALRDAMPVNTRARGLTARRTAEVDADIARANAIWATAGDVGDGPWLFGDFCAADIMFAPVASRFQTYDVAPDPSARDYHQRLLAHPLVAEWFALGASESGEIARFERPLG